MKKYIKPTFEKITLNLQLPYAANDIGIGSLVDSNAEIGSSDGTDGSGNDFYIGGAKDRGNSFGDSEDLNDSESLW